MSSINQKPAAKQLGEILQDQQEPFTLQLYLLEKGYKDSTAFLNKKPISTTNKKWVIKPVCKKILRAVFSKLASVKLKIKNPDTKSPEFAVRKICKGTRQEHEEERFSSASSTTTVFHSCSGSDTEDKSISSQKRNLSASTKDSLKQRNLLIKGEVPTDKILPSTYEEENKQQSPVSVLEVAALSADTSPVQNQEETNKSIISSDNSSQYNKIKMALQQTRQLLFDCMREVVETHVVLKKKKKKKNITKQKRFTEFAGPEDLGKLLCENIWTWSSTQSKSTQMLPSLEEWSSFEQQRREVAMEIGDFILQDITNVIVSEMMGLH